MSVRRLHDVQPDSFSFSEKNLTWANAQLTKFPADRKQSAVIPLLWRAQEQNENWVSEPAIRYLADFLDMPYIRVLEVATFYTMFQLQPVGKKAHVQVCGTTPCMLRGANELKAVCRTRIAQNPHVLSADGNFSWEEVECLGACVNAPMVQIFSDTYEDLTVESFESLLDAIDAGREISPGPQIDRQFAAAEGGATTLTDMESLNSVLSKSSTSEPEPAAGAEDALFTSPDGSVDDLKRISGVGPVLEKKLNALGVTQFSQVAAFTQEEIEAVDARLNFKGRIVRENWLEQARKLAGEDA